MSRASSSTATAVLAFALLAKPGLAIPVEFGSPFNPPPKLFFALAGMQVQSDHSWDMSIGGAYGLTQVFSPSYSLERTSAGNSVVGFGAGAAEKFWGTYSRLGVSVSFPLESDIRPAYALAMDWGRPLWRGISTYGELGGGLTAGGAGMVPGFNFDQSLDITLTPWIGVDAEYLGGLSSAGRTETLCGDLNLSVGRTYITGTVLIPRVPQALSPMYLLSTEFRMFP